MPAFQCPVTVIPISAIVFAHINVFDNVILIYTILAPPRNLVDSTSGIKIRTLSGLIAGIAVLIAQVSTSFFFFLFLRDVTRWIIL